MLPACPLGEEGACISGTVFQATFGSTVFQATFGSFPEERNCLSVIGAYLTGASILNHAGVNMQTSDLAKREGAFYYCPALQWSVFLSVLKDLESVHWCHLDLCISSVPCCLLPHFSLLLVTWLSAVYPAT